MGKKETPAVKAAKSGKAKTGPTTLAILRQLRIEVLDTASQHLARIDYLIEREEAKH